MKTNNAFFISYNFFGILLITVLFAFFLYIHNKSNISLYAMQNLHSVVGSGSSMSKDDGLFAGAQTDFSFSKFNQIKAFGNWDILIKRGDKYQVKVFAEKQEPGNVVVEQQGNVLYFRMKGGLFGVFKNRINVEIVLPQLKSIESYGGSKIAFAEFKGDRLSINLSGASYLDSQHNNFSHMNIESSGGSKINMLGGVFSDLSVELSGGGRLTAKDSEVANLSLEAKGGSRADFANSKTTNATIDLSGASVLTIDMNGGSLKGEASGASKIVYSGNVSTQDVITHGVSNVVKK